MVGFSSFSPVGVVRRMEGLCGFGLGEASGLVAWCSSIHMEIPRVAEFLGPHGCGMARRPWLRYAAVRDGPRRVSAPRSRVGRVGVGRPGLIAGTPPAWQDMDKRNGHEQGKG